MSRRSSTALATLAALALAAVACDVRPLTTRELYGAGVAGAGGAGAGGGMAGAAPDGGAGTGGATVDASPAETQAADAAPEAPVSACSAPCTADRFCDELTAQCSLRNGVGMLSGLVVDDCTGENVNALVGIAGQHACSFQGKGAYFFRDIPLGMLKLAAKKEGYELYGTTIEIVPGGVVHDIRLKRIGGCTAPRPAEVPCACTAPACVP